MGNERHGELLKRGSPELKRSLEFFIEGKKAKKIRVEVKYVETTQNLVKYVETTQNLVWTEDF